MALSITHLSLNEIHEHAGGNTGPFYNINYNADLNDNTIRVWGNNNDNSAYSTVTGAAGINTGSGTEISIGEFRGAEAPTSAFSGTMTSGYNVVSSGEQYVPDSYYSGFVNGTRGSHTNTSFTGTIAGRYATHTLSTIQNAGLGVSGGIISLRLENTSGSYSTSATDWSTLHVGSYSFNRSDANSSYAGTSGGKYYINYNWGRYYPTPSIFYSLSTYFGTTATNFSTYIDLT